MTYAVKGEKVFALPDPGFPDCTPPRIKRSDHRLKAFSSNNDKRAWHVCEEQRNKAFYDVVSGSQTCLLGDSSCHKYVPLEDLINILMSEKDELIRKLEDELRRCCKNKGENEEDQNFGQGDVIAELTDELNKSREMLRKAMHKLQNIDEIVNENKVLHCRLRCSEERIKFLEEKKKCLESELEDLRSKSQIQIDLERAQEMLLEVTQKRDSSSGDEVGSLTSERDRLQEKVIELERELEESKRKESEIKSLRETSKAGLDKDEISIENECYQKKLASMRCLEKQIQDLKKHGRALADKYKREAQKAAEQMNRMCQASKELQALREERDSLRKRVKELSCYEGQYNALQRKLKSVEEVIAENEILNCKMVALEKLEKENEYLRCRLNRIQEMENTAAEDKERIMQLQCAVADQEEEMKELLCQIERLTSGTHQEELERLRCELYEKNSKLKLCEEQLAEIPMLEAEIDELRAKLQTCCREFPEKKTGKSRCQRIEVRLPAATSGICAKYKLQDQKSSSIIKRRCEEKASSPCVESAPPCSESDMMTCEEVQNLLQSSKGIISCVLEDMVEHQKEMEELEKRNKTMKDEIEMLKAKVETDKSGGSQEVEDLKKALEEANKEICRLKEAGGSSEEDVELLKELNTQMKEELQAACEGLKQITLLEKKLEAEHKARCKAERQLRSGKEFDASTVVSDDRNSDFSSALQGECDDLKLQIAELKKLTDELKKENELLRELQKPCPDFSKELDEKCALENLLSLLQAELDAFKGQKLSNECEALRNELKRVMEQNCQLKALVDCYRQRLDLEKSSKVLNEQLQRDGEGKQSSRTSEEYKSTTPSERVTSSKVSERTKTSGRVTSTPGTPEIYETPSRLTPGTPGKTDTPDKLTPGTPGTYDSPDKVTPGTPGTYDSPDKLAPGTQGTYDSPDQLTPGTPGKTDTADKVTPSTQRKSDTADKLAPSTQGKTDSPDKVTPGTQGKTDTPDKLAPGTPGKTDTADKVTPGTQRKSDTADKLAPGTQRKSDTADKVTPGTQGKTDTADKVTPGTQGKTDTADKLAPGTQGKTDTADKLAPGTQGKTDTADKLAPGTQGTFESPDKLTPGSPSKVEPKGDKSQKDEGQKDCEAELERLRQQLADKEGRLQAMEEEVRAAKEEARAAKEEVRAAKEEARAAKEEARAAKEEAKAAKEEAGAAKGLDAGSAKAGEDDAAALRERLKQLEAENAEKLKALMDQHEKELANRDKAYNDNLNAMKAGYETDIRKLADRHKQSVIKLQGLHEDEVQELNTTYESQMEMMQTQSQAAINDVAKGSAAKLKKLADQHNKDLEDKDKELDKLREGLNRSQRELETLKKKLGSKVDVEGLQAKHSRELSAIKEKYEEEKKKSDLELENLKKKGPVCDCRLRRKDRKPKDPCAPLDFIDVIEKILDQGLDALTFNEIALVHRKACCALERIVMNSNVTPSLEPAVGDCCPHVPLLEADRQQLLRKIFALQNDIQEKQKQTQETIINMEVAIKRERCRLLDLKNLLIDEQRKNSELKMVIQSQSQIQTSLKKERDELGNQASLHQSLFVEKSKQLDQEVQDKKSLKDEVERLKTQVKQLCFALEMSKGQSECQQNDQIEILRMKLEQAQIQERKLEFQLENEAKCRMQLQCQVQALRQSFKQMVNLPAVESQMRVPQNPLDAKSAKEMKNLDQIKEKKNKAKPSKKQKK